MEEYQAWKQSGSKVPFRDTLPTQDLFKVERLEDWLERKAPELGLKEAMQVYF